MSIRLVYAYRLRCDGCGYTADFTSTTSTEARLVSVTMDGYPDGWRLAMVVHGPRLGVSDYCPACAVKQDPTPPLPPQDPAAAADRLGRRTGV